MIRAGVMLALALLAAACARAPTPAVIEKIVEKPVTVIVEQTRLVERQVVVTATPTPTPAWEPVSIIWWTDPLFQNPKTHPEVGAEAGAYEKRIAAEYRKLRPHVTIEVVALDWAELPRQLDAAVAAGAPPDLAKGFLTLSAGYAQRGLLVDMNVLLPPAIREDLWPGLREMYTLQGQLHALPAYFWTQQLLYNRAALEDAGLASRIPPAEKPEWTFDDYYALGKALQSRGAGRLLAAGAATEQTDYALLGFLLGAGAPLWRNDCAGLALDSPQALAGLEFLNRLYREGLMNADVATAGWQEVEDLLLSGRALTTAGSLYLRGPAADAARREGRVKTAYDPQLTLFPHAAGAAVVGPIAGPTGYFVFQKAGRSPAQLQELANFLLYLNGEERLTEACINSGQLPARQSVGARLWAEPAYEQALRWVRDYGVASVGLQCPRYAEVRAALPPFFRAMFLKQMTPQQALEGMRAKARALINP